MANLQTSLRAVLPREIAVEATGIPQNHVRANARWREMLPPRCSQKRLAEFAVGRYCAARALGRLGARTTDVGVGSAREPIAPEGYSVSISHDDCHAVAVAGRSAAWPGLGIDIEPDSPLDAELLAVVCSDSERASRPDDITELDYAKQLFSIKESVFKAAYPRAQTVLDWPQIAVALEGEDRFVAGLRNVAVPDMRIEGFSRRLCGKWISFASVA